MGAAAERLLDGLDCCHCGETIDGEAPGYSRSCCEDLEELCIICDIKLKEKDDAVCKKCSSYEIDIFKVQLAVSGDTEFLVYNEYKTLMQMQPISNSILNDMDGELKKFFYGFIDENKILNFLCEAEWQDW